MKKEYLYEVVTALAVPMYNTDRGVLVGRGKSAVVEPNWSGWVERIDVEPTHFIGLGPMGKHKVLALAFFVVHL